LLETRLADIKQVSQYADLLNLSTYQLNSITKTTVGKAASELINEQIILEAKRYLLATTNQVKDIASQLGYEDVSYFIRFFKKHTGHSPEAFRKISR
jgi:AraC family transcriptional regulator, transcriptional activator of pobA